MPSVFLVLLLIVSGPPAHGEDSTALPYDSESGLAPQAVPMASAAGRTAPETLGEVSDQRPWHVGDGTAGSVVAR